METKGKVRSFTDVLGEEAAPIPSIMVGGWKLKY
jgi:hypothetical protein